MKPGYGSNQVIAAVIVRLPMAGRPVAVQVLAKLVIKGMTSASRLWLACRMAQMLAAALACRDTRVVADAACAGKELKGLPPGITWTARWARTPSRTSCPRLLPGDGDGPAHKAISCRSWLGSR